MRERVSKLPPDQRKRLLKKAKAIVNGLECENPQTTGSKKMNLISNFIEWIRPIKLPAPKPEPLPPKERDALKQRTIDTLKGASSPGYDNAKKKVLKTLMTKAEKEAFIAQKLACPNCGATQFDEVCSNAALTFRCDCGLSFNFMPQLRIVEIVNDPQHV